MALSYSVDLLRLILGRLASVQRDLVSLHFSGRVCIGLSAALSDVCPIQFSAKGSYSD
jgi:hypothetical protein